MSSTSLRQLVEDYLADARSRGLSPKTLNSGYGFILQQVLLPWCERQGITDPSDLNDRVLNRFTVELLHAGGKRGPLSRHTVATYVRNVNLFLRWSRREGEIGDVRAQAPRVPKRVLEVLSREECAAERMVPVQPELFRRLQRLARSRQSDAEGDGLFVALRRSPRGLYGGLTLSGLEQLVQGLGERASIGRRVYPHLFRHSFATEMLNRGMDAVTLSRILGHSSFVMIHRTYANQTVGDLSEALLRALARE